MYSIDDLKLAVRNPREVMMELNARYCWWRNGCKYNPDGIDILSKDWDFLILLDALRADDFMKLNTLPGDLSIKESKGGGTVEFLHGNFKGRDITDTVYVTGNPQFEAHYEELNAKFHAVDHVWKRKWDDENKTVQPAVMAQATIQAAEEYPNKRIISHFVQPHEPFIGPIADKHNLEGWIDPDRTHSWKDVANEAIQNVFSKRDQALYRQAYRENIELALPHVKSIFNSADGKIVVTSDHGEMFGERASPIPIKYDSHRIGCHTEALLDVPWLEYSTGNRREIQSGSSEFTKNDPGEEVSDRLQDLGYL